MSVAALSVLACRAALAQDATLACFAARADTVERIANCTAALRRGDLAADTRALALVARAQAYVSAGDARKAVADFDAALDLAPQDAVARLGRGKLREQAGSLALAEADYSAAIAADPQGRNAAVTGEAYTRRGAVRMKRGRMDDAIVDLGEARRFNPKDPGPFKARGSYFLERGDAARAITELEQATALDPGDAEAHTLLGYARLRAGKAGEAVTAFTAALAAGSANNGPALRGRGTAYGRLQNYAAAIADFTAALRLDPKDIAALESRGVAELQSGAYAAAAADFTLLLSARPGDLSATFLRGNARLQGGDAAGAARDFTAVLRRRPGDHDALMSRAVARQFTGEFAGAEDDLTAILERVADAAQPLANRGYVRMMKGEYAAAARDLALAMELPNAPPELAVWRFVAEAHGGHKPMDVLRAAAEPLVAEHWPAPLLRYFLGAISGDQLLTAAAQDPEDSAGRACEAYYFLGHAALLSQDGRQAAKLFQAALATGMSRHTEYIAAKAELERLGHGP